MHFPFRTRYVYFACGLVLILAGVAGVSQTSRGQEILTDFREEFNPQVDNPAAPKPPEIASEPRQTPATITPVTKPALEKQVVLVQNAVMREQDEFLLLRSQNQDRFFLKDPADTGWSILAQYPSTIETEISSTPVELINLDNEAEGFQGEFYYQEPETARTFRISTDGVRSYPLARSVEYDGSTITYAFVPEEQVVEFQNLGLVSQYRLTTPEATLRRIDLATASYTDEAIVLPEEVTRRLSDIYVAEDIVYVNGAYLEGEGRSGPPTYDGYRAEGEVIYKDDVEIGRIPLRGELAGLQVFDFQDGLVYLKSVLPGEYNPGSNLLTYNPETGEFDVVFSNDYDRGRSDYVFFDARRYSLADLANLQISREDSVVKVTGSEVSFGEENSADLVSLEVIEQAQVEKARDYTGTLTYQVPAAFQGSAHEHHLVPGTLVNYAGHKVLLTHHLANSSLTLLPRDSAFMGTDHERTLASLPEFFATGNPEVVRGQDRLPGWANLFYAFHPFIYSGPAYYQSFVEEVEAPGYARAWVAPYSQYYGGCSYGYALFLEGKKDFSYLAVDGANHGYSDLGDPFDECRDEACVEEKFQTLPKLVATKEALLSEAKALRVIK